MLKWVAPKVPPSPYIHYAHLPNIADYSTSHWNTTVVGFIWNYTTIMVGFIWNYTVFMVGFICNNNLVDVRDSMTGRNELP